MRSLTIPVSVLILTYNEQANIKQCLENALMFSDDVYILDSYSTDLTTQIAEGYIPKERIFRRKFDNYSNQRNWALDNVPFKYEWLLELDADEILTREVAEEFSLYFVKNDEGVLGLRVRYRFYFMGKLLPYRVWPFSKICFIKHREIRYSRTVNEQPQPIKEISCWGQLQHFLLHKDNKNLHQYLWKHNRYSTMEAFIKSEENTKIHLKDFFTRDKMQRRTNLKALFYKLPARPLLLFIYMYFLKLGFTAGKQGLQFCLIQSFQQLTISMKIDEFKKGNINSIDEYKRNGWE